MINQWCLHQSRQQSNLSMAAKKRRNGCSEQAKDPLTRVSCRERKVDHFPGQLKEIGTKLSLVVFKPPSAGRSVVPRHLTSPLCAKVLIELPQGRYNNFREKGPPGLGYINRLASSQAPTSLARTVGRSPRGRPRGRWRILVAGPNDQV